MPNIQINLTKQVTTLATQNKYIPSNIDLIPQTEEKTITENGTFTPSEGKLGFSKVIVNIPKTTWTFNEKEQTYKIVRLGLEKQNLKIHLTLKVN